MFLTGNEQKLVELSDEEVFLKALTNPDAFSIIFDRYQPAFLRKAKDILKSEEEAYDAVQEAFVRIYSAARQYRKMEGATFKSWAYKILINQCYTLYQKNKKRFEQGIDLTDSDMELLEDKVATDEHQNKLTKDYVISLISKLPVILARVVDLYFIQEVPQKEIANREGVSNEVIRARIHRAKKELRQIEINLNI